MAVCAELRRLVGRHAKNAMRDLLALQCACCLVGMLSSRGRRVLSSSPQQQSAVQATEHRSSSAHSVRALPDVTLSYCMSVLASSTTAHMLFS